MPSSWLDAADDAWRWIHNHLPLDCFNETVHLIGTTNFSPFISKWILRLIATTAFSPVITLITAPRGFNLLTSASMSFVSISKLTRHIQIIFQIGNPLPMHLSGFYAFRYLQVFVLLPNGQRRITGTMNSLYFSNIYGL